MAKTVLITGASSGFGKESAVLFQKKGWNVIATMRSPNEEQELTRLQNVLIVRLDVQDTDSIHLAVKAGVDRFQKIDVLVNNAGYAVLGVFESATSEQIRKQFEVNVFGLMDVTQIVLPYLRINGSGVIINVSSMGGRVTFPLMSLYHATKFAVEGFSESLSHELSKVGIKVKLIEPGGVETNFRSGMDMIVNTIPAYDLLMDSVFLRYSKTTEHLTKATAKSVADKIYQAATDETNQLRYSIGGDADFYIEGKIKNNDHDYLALMRKYFID